MRLLSRIDVTVSDTPSIGKPRSLASPTRRRHQSTSSQASALPEKSYVPQRDVSTIRDTSPMRVDIRAGHDSMLQTNSNPTRTTPASSPLDPGFPRDPNILAALAPPGPGLPSSASAPAAKSTIMNDPTEADLHRGEYEEAPRTYQDEPPRGEYEDASRQDHEAASRAKTVRALKSLERFVASLSAKTMSTLSSARSLVSLASGQSSSERSPQVSHSKASGTKFSRVSGTKLSHSEASGLSSRPVSRLPPSRSEVQHDYEGEFGVLSSNAAHFAPPSRSRMTATKSGLSAATTAGTVSELPWRRPIGHSMTMDSTLSEAWAPSSLPGKSSAFPTTQSSTSLTTSPSRLPRLRMRLGSGASDTGRRRVISKEDISGPAALQSVAGVARLREKASAERVLRGTMRNASAPRMVKSASTDRVQAKTVSASVGRQHRRAEALRGDGAGAAHKRSRPLDGGVLPLPIVGSKGMSRSVTAAEMRRGGGEEFVSNRATL
ncbi:hypothetical protein EV715DRAFT_255369 [Schizophyllum commune]